MCPGLLQEETCNPSGTVSFLYSFNIYLSFYTGSYETLTYLNLGGFIQ